MSRKPIPVILPTLPARAEAESPKLVAFQPGLPYQTMILGKDGYDGYVEDIVADLIKLKKEGWVESWVKLPRLDGYGDYLSVLINREQALGIKNTNDGYRLFERGHIQAMTKNSLPSWARTGLGEPAHVFWGQQMPEDGYGG